MTQELCYVCRSQATRLFEQKLLGFNCRRCGSYLLEEAATLALGRPTGNVGILDNEAKIAAVAHWLRQRNTQGSLPLLSAESVKLLAKNPYLPSLQDQRQNLVKFIGDITRSPGSTVDLGVAQLQFSIGALREDGVGAILGQLREENLVSHTAGQGYFLTYPGWLAYEDIKRGKSTGRTAFMAMPFGKKDIDEVWYPQLKRAVKQTGFTLQHLDEEPKPGLIDIRMQVQIKAARFLIVELTHANNGAYWEAGFAHGLGKPVIYTCRKDQEVHFDVDHWYRVTWDPADLGPALERVKAVIRNELPDARLEAEPEA